MAYPIFEIGELIFFSVFWENAELVLSICGVKLKIHIIVIPFQMFHALFPISRS